MAKDAAEHFHPNPAVRRARAKSAGMLGGKVGSSSDTNPHGKSLEHHHGPVTRTEVEKHEDGTAHVIAHHKDGHAETNEHSNEAEAHDHAKSMMAGGGEAPQGDSDTQQAEEAMGGGPAAGEGGEQGGEEGEEESCPNCGGQMQDGKCTQCGYKEQAKASPEEEDQGY